MDPIQRAYSAFEVKAIDNSKRTFRGWATTPAVDRMGDEIDPLGAKFKNPLPLLHQHKHDQVIGWVRFSAPTRKGIEFEAEIASIDEPGPLKDRVDTAWGEIKHGLVRAVSIGFRPLKYAFKEDGGIDFKEVEVLEMSSVTIPALPEAVITQVKSMAGGALPRDVIQTIKTIDTSAMPSSGPAGGGAATPGVSGIKKKAVQRTVSIHSQTRESKMNVQDQIKQYESLREKKVAEMDEIMEKSAQAGETLNAEQEEKYDSLTAELDAIDKHLERLRRHEKSLVSKARTVEGTSVSKASESRGGDQGDGRKSTGPTIIVKGDKDEAFEGQNYTRIVIAKTLARLDGISAVGIAQRRWGKTNPQLVEVVRAAVEGGGTGTGEWGAELAASDSRYTGDFIDYLYAQTIFDQLPLREIPANVFIKGQDGTATGYWVGESKSIPVSKADFFDVELRAKKVAALAVVSKELLRDSSPSAEMLVRDSLVKASAQRVDLTFLGTGASSATTPAGILNGVTPMSSSGSDGQAVREDIGKLYAPFLAAFNAGDLQLVMNKGLGKALSLMTNALGNTEFPQITANGGSLLGDPVKTGDNVNPSHLILLKPSDIYKIGDRGVEVSMSTEASIQMDDAPDGASDTPVANTSLVSMYQTDSVALKVVRPINFAKRRASAVAYINDANYGQATSSP